MTGQLLTGNHFLAERGRRAVGLVALLSVMSLPQPPVAAPKTQESIVPLPFTADQDPAKVVLGERLFHDVRLSRDNSMSCATCHQLKRGGDDALPRSKTATGNLLHRNAPTVFNVALNPSFNWDGGVPSLEVQAERVLLNPKVMNNTWPVLIRKLRTDPDYLATFNALYPDSLNPATVVDALVSYERSLVTPNARFDRYLRGERQALSTEELQGYKLFKAYGCVSCHQGVNVGGNLFQKFGVFPGPAAPPNPREGVDLGRFNVTKVARDREVFRVPSLRNVALTAPYFHDGRARTLKKAVGTMARVQLDRRLNPQEISLIVQFLHTLTGEYRGRPLAVPTQEAQ
jgi:cytochrome c peroxidase